MSVNRKKSDSQVNGSGARVKLRWMELDVQGGTAELVEGFKSFATALRTGSEASTRTLIAPAPSRNEGAVAVMDPPPLADNDEDAIAQPVDETPETAVATGTDSPKRRPAPKAPKFLGELDLTKSSVQLRDFVEEKQPRGDMDRFAVIAAWFKQHLNIEELSIDHIFTSYKALGWQAELPDDLGQTFRNLKSNKNWFDGGSKRGMYKLNWNGESAVNKMGVAKP